MSCNAGIAWSGLISDMTDSEWRRIVDVNLGGVFNCCRAAIPYMVRRKAGSIVCVSSVLGVYGGSCETAYSATKGGIIAFVKGPGQGARPKRHKGERRGARRRGYGYAQLLTAEEKAGMIENIYLGRLARLRT